MDEFLIYDAAGSGHHGEFLENMISGLPDTGVNYVILAHPQLRERLEGAKLEYQSAVRLEYLVEEQLAALAAAKRLIVRGRLELDIVVKYCATHPIRKVIMMHMNVHQFGLGRRALPKGVTIRGLLLNPYTPLRRAFGLRAKAFAFVTGLRKRLQFAWMLQNRSIERVFLLNDPSTAEQLNQWFPRRAVFASIPDPLPALSGQVEMPAVRGAARRPYCFLMAGSIAPRKGCLEVLAAFAILAESIDRPIRLQILGRFREEYRDYRNRVFERVKQLNARPGITVVVEDRFISDQELQEAFAEADCILAPYLDFYGSSGMIGYACRYQKPLLACRDGLIGEIVQKQRLGLVVNPRYVSSLSSAMACMVKGDFEYSKESASRYKHAAQVSAFVNSILGCSRVL